MTDYTMTHPLWMWVYFGTCASVGTILFTLIVWHSMRVNALASGYQRSASRWNMVGYLFLFSAAWFACGIGGPPGNLLSSDPAAHDEFLAVFEATLSMFLSVPGWACVLMGQRRTLQGTRREGGNRDPTH